MAHRKLRMMSSAETHNTTTGPMSEVMRRALEIEKEPGVLAVAIFPTQPWMDVHDLGWSIVVAADGDRALAQAKADEIGMMCWERRERFLVHKTPIREAVERSLAGEGKPYVLSDSSDSVTGGGNGDGNFLLKTLLEMGYADTAIITLTDPRPWPPASPAGVGATLTLPVGGKLTPTFYSPITVTGTVNTLWNGQYTAFLTPMPWTSAERRPAGRRIRLLLSRAQGRHHRRPGVSRRRPRAARLQDRAGESRRAGSAPSTGRSRPASSTGGDRPV